MRQLHTSTIDWLALERSDKKKSYFPVTTFSDNPVDDRIFKDLISEVNSWQSDNIAKFISPHDVGSYMQVCSNHDHDMYFGYVDGKLSVVTIVEGGMNLPNYQSFQDCIATYDEDFKIDKPNFITLSNARLALSNATSINNSSINVLVVNPKEQGKGVGTSAVRDIASNNDFFAGHSVNVTNSKVNIKNIASSKVFINNGYAKLFGEKPDFGVFDNYYLINNDFDKS